MMRARERAGPPVPIGEYALLGDTRTAALSSPAGSIDWMCVPRFDGEPVFGTLVGGSGAGHFAVSPVGAGTPRRRYRAGTPVLESSWPVSGGEVTLVEGMVSEAHGALRPSTLLVRRVEAAGCDVEVDITFEPRFGVDRRVPRVARVGEALTYSCGGLALSLQTAPSLAFAAGGSTRVVVERGRSLTLVLCAADREPLIFMDPMSAWEALLRDEAGWRRWSETFDDMGPFHAASARSLLVLRLLSYSPSGAPVAAPSTSLPEEIGGSRNWDYRYAWPRDASIGIGAFLSAGDAEAARSFFMWLLHATRLDRPRIPPVLSLDGKPVPPERHLANWAGYADSRPVRFGNAAGGQHQLDVYGWVLDAAWLLTQAGHGLYAETWRALAASVDLVATRWRDPDDGIWEERHAPTHHVHSKLMAWLALDRAIRISGRRRTPARRRSRWAQARDALVADVLANGFDEKRNTFVRAYESDELDAAVLVLPLLGFEPVTSPRVTGTIRAIRRELDAGNGLLYRYPPRTDGLPGAEGAFLPCSFWLAQALAATGQHREAGDLLDQLLTLGGPLGLFAEEIDPRTLTQLGNFPQALTHAALVQAVLAIRDVTRAGAALPVQRRRPGARGE
jgi:GH15 family glucan-1,4-alpha-glucosidase